MIAWLRGAGLALARQFAKFGVVGAVAYVVDVGVFNMLRYAGEDPVMADQPLTAKIMSSAVATVVSWLGNRYWTFRHTRRPQARREFLIFVLMCAIGLGISLSILWFSHYVIGFTSPLADNIAANVVGLAAGTLFRFWAYRRFVFTHVAEPGESKEAAADPRLEPAPFGGSATQPRG
jgi:putative flippase GtrA